MQALNVALVQGETRWHDAAANREYYAGLVRSAAADSDLVVLPETFLTGFTNDTEDQSVPMDGEDVAWLRELAREVDAVVTGSLVIVEDGRHFNRMFWMRPDGRFETYDKRHLFRMADEHEHFSAGRERLIVELNGWRICPLVCYDLRFPAWSRNRRNEAASGGMDYDLLIYVANWPAPRRNAWRTLLRARAVENLACCVGVNRVGEDGKGIAYAGDSGVFDARGETVLELNDREQVATAALDPAPMLELRRKFPAWMDADEFTLHV